MYHSRSPRSVLVSLAIAALTCMAAVAQSSVNTRLPRVQSTGSVIVSITGQFATTPTDSFTLQKQVFSGSTNCSSGGGAITYVPNVGASSNDITAVTSADSIYLSPAPSTTHNAQYIGVQNMDGATISYLPGNAVCVAGFSTGTHTILAQYAPGIEVLDAACSNPKYYYRPGDTVCVRVTGAGGTGGTPWKTWIGGGTNECDSFTGLGPLSNVTGESMTATFVLPANNAAIPAGCTAGSNTTDIRGNWRAMLLDNLNTNRASEYFRLHDSNPFYDLSVSTQTTDLANSSTGYPPTGNIKYQISVQNNGPDAASGVSLSQGVPASTSFVSMVQKNGPTFNCTGPSGGNETCTVGLLAPDQYAYFEMVVHYSGLTNGTMLSSTTNVTGTGGTDPFIINNSATSTVTITNNTNVGQFLCPSDITAVSTSGSGANVSYPNYTTTATYTGGNTTPSIASGGLFPIGTTLIGWQSISGSGSCFFNVTVTDGQRPDLQATKTHVGLFPRGLNSQQYTITVSNTGSLATVGLVTLIDTMPQGLIPTSISGAGWNCSLATVSCNRSDPLAGHSSYPPITLIVNVPRYLSSSVFPYQNTVTVSGGGEGVTANDTANDTTGLTNPLNYLPKADFNGDGNSEVFWHNNATGQNTLWEMSGASVIAGVPLPQLADTNWKLGGVGDFNGDGKPDLIWRNISTGQVGVWLMNGTSVASTTTVATVPPVWQIIGVGDVNNDGKADVFWWNSLTGDVTVWLMNGATPSGVAVGTVPDTSWFPVGVGDFNGDGMADIFWRNRTTGQNSIWFMNGASIGSTALTNTVSDLNFKVVGIGDANGDGRADVFWWNSSTGAVVVWLMNGATASGATVGTVADTTYRIEGVGDFDGDGKVDLIWRKVTTGDITVWLMNGQTVKQSLFVSTLGDLNWSIQSAMPPPPKTSADFTGDGKSDVFWRNGSNGLNTIWQMNGLTVTVGIPTTQLPDTNWKLGGVGDFNGDGQPDLIWRNTSTGDVGVWLMNGTSVASTTTVATIPTVWQIVGVGDVNGDGKADVFWWNSSTGDLVVWLMNGATPSGTTVGGIPDPNWKPVGVGDFNGDGMVDVFWRNTATGQNGIWFMNGAAIGSTANTNTVADLNYQVVGIGDTNGDGKADVIWRHAATGDVVVWLMSGATPSGGLVATVADLNYHIEGVGDFDNDGKADLIWRKVTTGDVSVWLMNGTAIKGSAYVTTIGDLNWAIVH